MSNELGFGARSCGVVVVVLVDDTNDDEDGVVVVVAAADSDGDDDDIAARGNKWVYDDDNVDDTTVDVTDVVNAKANDVIVDNDDALPADDNPANDKGRAGDDDDDEDGKANAYTVELIEHNKDCGSEGVRDNIALAFGVLCVLLFVPVWQIKEQFNYIKCYKR